MSLDPAAVRRIAKLARIRVAEDALPQLAGDLNAILGWIEQLNEVDIDGVTPLENAARNNVKLREDIVDDGGDAERVLFNAPDREGQFYAVPKVVE